MKTVRAADLFCGAGGTSAGLRDACDDLGRRLDLLAINHWPVAIETHSTNHPYAEHLCESLDVVDPRKVVPGGKLDLLVASPECFPADTLILTDQGLMPIEDVQDGMRVLTHKKRWKRVTSTQLSWTSTVILRGQGHYGLETTEAHPFYASVRERVWNQGLRLWRFHYSAPGWVEAWDMPNRYWATPTQFPFLRIEACGMYDPTPAFWWAVGRWLGDGSVSLRPGKGGEITVSCGNHEADDLAPKLQAGFKEAKITRRKVRTATLFELRDTALAKWLVKHFGKLAHGKTIPAWALGMHPAYRSNLLDGYKSADGHFNGRTNEITTVSKSLAIGVRLLIESLGGRVSIHTAPQHSKVIEGREVNGRDVYRVKWVENRLHEYGMDTDGLSFSRVRSVEFGRKSVAVYNLSVETDESYVADGIVVHNCTHHSNARGGKPMSDQSRASAWHVARWAEALSVSNILIENVREFRDWGPLDSKGRPIKKRKGELYGAFLNTLRAMGYNVEDRILNAADYGDPTSRRRLFIVARKGNRRVRWPEPLYSPKGEETLFGTLPAYRTARGIIDWENKGQSIFNRKKALSPNTMRRIMAGLAKFSGLPFILGQQSGATPRSVEDPIPTVAGAGAISMIEPFIIPYHRERDGQAPRGHSVDEPLPVVATSPFGLAEPYIVAYHQEENDGAARCNSINEPLPTIDTSNRYAVAEPYVVQLEHSTHASGDWRRAHSTDKPLPTLTAQASFGVAEPYVVQMEHPGDRAFPTDVPMPAITSKAHFGLAQPYLVKYYGNGVGQPLDEPLGTVTGVDRYGLCIPVGDGYAIVDILFRMLEPGELAKAHSLDDYQFAGTKRDIVKQIGNSVPRRLAKALCMAALA